MSPSAAHNASNTPLNFTGQSYRPLAEQVDEINNDSSFEADDAAKTLEWNPKSFITI